MAQWINIPKPIITREHGAWAVLLVPIAVAASAANAISAHLVFFIFSALAVFLGYVPAQALLRAWLEKGHDDEKLSASKFWLMIYGGMGFLFLLPLVASGYRLLLVIGAVGAGFFFGNFFLTRASGKTIASDLFAVLGLTLTAPSTYYVATGELNSTAVMLWLLNALFFGCSVFYVHMKMTARVLKLEPFSVRERLSIGRLNLLYHLAVISIIVLLTALHYTPLLMVVVFLPMAVHSLYGTVKLSSRVRFKNLGFILLGHALLFGVLLSFVKL